MKVHLFATLCLHSHALRSFPIKAIAFPAPVFMPAEGIMDRKTLIISFDRVMPCVRRARGGHCVRLPAASQPEIEVLHIESRSQKEGAETPLATSADIS